MKKVLALILAISLAFAGFAQEEKKSPYEFTAVKDIPVTSVKNQFRSGTCWSFSAISFVESEILRLSKKEYDLSDMYPVYCSFLAKADRYARLHGETNFPTGGASGDVFWTIDNYGMVPESIFTGLQYGEDKHNHGMLDKMLSTIMKNTIDGARKLDTNWKFPFKAMLNAYLGQVPQEFTYEGKKYTPQSFAKNLNINTGDYVKLTSYTHHPFYTTFAIEVPDNWLMHEAYNVPMNEFRDVVLNALNNGYSVVWGGDVSDKGFSWKNGVAIIPDEEKQESLEGTDRDRWESMNQKQRSDEVYKFETIVKEKVITQQMRQYAYDTWESTDDHGMHIVGLAKDQNGNTYLKIKNSWDVTNPYDGYIYMSLSYFDLRTLDITVHKDAIPAPIKKKLNIK